MNSTQRRKTSTVRLPRKKKPDLDKWAVPLGSIISGGMVAMALPSLVDVSGFGGIAKAVLITGGTMLATYSVNRFAIDKGTDLASRGYLTAGIASLGSMTFVGLGLFASTYAGLTLPDVEELRLREHGSAYTQFISARSLKAAEAVRTLPVMRSINRELQEKLQCEFSQSCISGRGDGGRGTVTRVLEEMAGHASIIADQLETGETARKDTLAHLNGLVGDYQSALGQADLNIWDKRGELQKIDSELGQIIAELDEAIPTTFLRSYADELETGAVIPERPVATRRLNDLLKRNGQSLSAVLDTLDRGDQTRPKFPARTGVTDTFNYLGHFAPIALLTAGIELVWPLCLWTYTLLYLLWGIHLVDPRLPPEDTSNRHTARRSRRHSPRNKSGGYDAE